MRVKYLLLATAMLFIIAVLSLVAALIPSSGSSMYNEVFNRNEAEYYVFIYNTKHETESNCKWGNNSWGNDTDGSYCEDALTEARRIAEEGDKPLFIIDANKNEEDMAEIYEAIGFTPKFEYQIESNNYSKTIREIEALNNNMISNGEDTIKALNQQIVDNDKFIAQNAENPEMASEVERLKSENERLKTEVDEIQSEIEGHSRYEELLELREKKKISDKLWADNLNTHGIGTPLFMHMKNNEPVSLFTGRHTFNVLKLL